MRRCLNIVLRSLKSVLCYSIQSYMLYALHEWLVTHTRTRTHSFQSQSRSHVPSPRVHDHLPRQLIPPSHALDPNIDDLSPLSSPTRSVCRPPSPQSPSSPRTPRHLPPSRKRRKTAAVAVDSVSRQAAILESFFGDPSTRLVIPLLQPGQVRLQRPPENVSDETMHLCRLVMKLEFFFVFAKIQSQVILSHIFVGLSRMGLNAFVKSQQNQKRFFLSNSRDTNSISFLILLKLQWFAAVIPWTPDPLLLGMVRNGGVLREGQTRNSRRGGILRSTAADRGGVQKVGGISWGWGILAIDFHEEASSFIHLSMAR